MKWLMLAAGLMLANAVQAQLERGYVVGMDADLQQTGVDWRQAPEPWLDAPASWTEGVGLDAWLNESMPSGEAHGADFDARPRAEARSQYERGFEPVAPDRDGWARDPRGGASWAPQEEPSGQWSQESAVPPTRGSGYSDGARRPDVQGYRFRGDPPLSPESGWDPQRPGEFRFRPLTPQERDRMGSNPRWRPLEERRGGERPSTLYDSMTPDDPAGEWDPEAWTPR